MLIILLLQLHQQRLLLLLIPVTKAPRVPSGQDLGGPFWFCPCIPTGVPEGPGGGMVGPIMPKLTNTLSTDT